MSIAEIGYSEIGNDVEVVRAIQLPFGKQSPWRKATDFLLALAVR